MGIENESRFVIAFDGKAGDLTALMSVLKRQIRSDVSEIEATISKVDLFKNLQQQAKDAATAFFATKERVRELREVIIAIQGAGGTIGVELAKSLKEAERAAASARKEFAAKSETLKKLGGELRTAGVDVKNLAAEETRLAKEAKAASAVLAQQGSKDLLGLKTLKDIQPQIGQLNAAFASLRDSGKLSFGETNLAAARLQQGIAKLQAETGGLGAAFTAIRAPLLAFGAALAGIGAAIKESSENYRAFAQQVAAVDSIAEVSKERIAALATGVRELARRLGVDAVASTRALYEILSSGIPADNALVVLELATRASIAGLTDVQTAAKVGVAVLNGYQLQISDLGHVYDVLFQTVKDGVVTFPDLAKNIGQVIPAARAAQVPLEELGAAFVVLTRSGIDAPEAATAINRAIIDLSAPAPEAAQRLRDLGIELRGLVGTVEQLSKKNLSLQQFEQIIPDVRAQRAVLLLSQQFDLLTRSLARARDSANVMEEAYQKMAATPQARVDRLNASFRDLSLSLGEFSTNATSAVEVMTGLANSFNTLGEKTKQTTIGLTALVAGLGLLGVLLRTLTIPLNLTGAALGSFATSGAAIVHALTVAGVAILGFKVLVSGLLGFKLGELLYEWSAAVRVLGDAVGLSAAAVVNLTNFGLRRLREALFGTADGAARVTAAFDRNRQIIGEGFAAVLSGATAKSYALEIAQRSLGAEFGRIAEKAKEAATGVQGSVTRLLAAIDAQIKGTDKALTDIKSTLTQLVAGLQQGVQQTQQAAQQAIAELAAQTATALASLQSVDVQRIRDTVAIQQKAAEDRLTILRTFATDAQRAFEAEATARLFIARQSKVDVDKVQQDIAISRRAVLQTIVDGFRAHVSELLALEKSHLDNIRAIENERRGINQEVEDKIREIRRGSLGAYEQYADKVSQIDDLLGKARAALARANSQTNQDLAAADFNLAAEYAKKAIGLSGSIAGEVKKGETVVVAGYQAEARAVSVLEQASSILNTTLTARVRAEKEGAEAAKAGLVPAAAQLQTYEAALGRVSAQAKQGVVLKITADVKAVETAVEQLGVLVAQKELQVAVQANLTKADNAIKALKDDLEKGIPVNFTEKVGAIAALLAQVQAAKPELTVLTTDATAKVALLRKAAEDLGLLKPKIDAVVTSNVGGVTRDFQALDGKRVTSYQDIIVTRTEGRALGGLVGERLRTLRTAATTPLQTFARGGRVFSGRKVPGSGDRDTVPATLAPQGFAVGGAVFRKGRVPGSGDRDTVPANLESGSFVLRKAASRFYGDKLIAALAQGKSLVQRFAKGGSALKEQVRDYAQDKWGYNPFPDGRRLPDGSLANTATRSTVIDPKKGFQSGDSFQSEAPPVNFDTRPIPEALITATNVLTYAREMLNFVGLTNPLMGKLGPVMQKQIAKVEGNPNDIGEIKILLQMAETLGANPYLFTMWEKTTASLGQFTPTWFIDWLEKNRAGDIAGDTGGSIAATEIATNAFARRFFSTNPLLRGANLVLSVQGKRRLVRGDPVPPNLPYDPKDDPQSKKLFRRFAKGGSTDIVQALLTPGEWVIKKPEVAKYGSGFMSDLNAMRIPRGVLADKLRPILPGEQNAPRRHAAGGAVGDIVPALLAPVIQKSSVAKYGIGLMRALNATMAFPRAALTGNFRRLADEQDDPMSAVTKHGPGLMHALSTFPRAVAMVRTPRVQRFASGGDIVPALLTPGEWVIKKSAVVKYGSGLMHALNKMAFPRAALAEMVRAPRVQRFADGGPVGDFGRLGGFAPISGPVTNNENNININVSVADLFSEANVRRFLLPILNSIQTRST